MILYAINRNHNKLNACIWSVVMVNSNIQATIVGDDGIEYYSTKDAQSYTGLSNNGLNGRIKKFNQSHPDSLIEKVNFGGRERYFQKSDLNRLFEKRVVR